MQVQRRTPVRRKKKVKLKIKNVLILAVILLAIIVGLVSCCTQCAAPAPEAPDEESSLPESSEEVSDESSEESSEEDSLPEGKLTDWNLILLNPEAENKLDEELDIPMTESDGQFIDSRVASAYEAMRADAKSAGHNLYLRSGFRKISLQQIYYDANVKKYMDQGHSREEAIRLTLRYFTEPGHSEHHSGLALDIITVEYHQQIYSLNEQFAKTEAFAWLSEHCAEYGFILRYPEGKTDITKINYEPWHYRYVGVEHAKYITENGLTFEEYIDLLEAAGR